MIRRITAMFLIGLGTMGVVVCALGVLSIWRTAERITAVAEDTLLLVSDTLDDVDYSLGVTSETLTGVTVAVDGLYTTTLVIGEALSSTKMTLDEMVVLAGDDLPTSIEASLVALEVVEETAAVIDRLLYGLHRLGVGNYDPEIPLDQAVAQAGAGLEPVPGNLRTMAYGLEQTSESLYGVQGGLGLMGDYMLGLQDNVADADVAVVSHRQTMHELKERVELVRQNVEDPVRTAAWGVTVLLGWIGISQLAIVRWGVRILTG